MTARIRYGLGVLAAAVLFFVAATWWALESSQVAIVETQTSDGATRFTHVWFAMHEGKLWLEAGTPENPWYRDVLNVPRIALSIEDTRAEFTAVPLRNASAQAQIRSLLHEKYGWRDTWVGLLVDASRSVAVRLDSIRPAEQLD